MGRAADKGFKGLGMGILAFKRMKTIYQYNQKLIGGEECSKDGLFRLPLVNGRRMINFIEPERRTTTFRISFWLTCGIQPVRAVNWEAPPIKEEKDWNYNTRVLFGADGP